MDCKDLTRTMELHAYMVPPTNLDDTYGELEGVDWDSLSITCGYYTDTRVSGSLSVVGGNWIRGSFLRIVMRIPGEGYERELATFAVSNDNSEYQNGVWVTDLELISMLHTMSLDLAPSIKAIAAGSSVLAAFRSECEAAGRKYECGAAFDAKTGGVTIMETGSSRLARCFDLSSMSNNRLDVNGHGVVTLERYTEPKAKAPVMTLDLQDERGVVADGISRTSNWLSTPSVAVVSYQYSDSANGETIQREITASVYVSATDHGSMSQRGYNVTDYTSLSEMNPPTYNQALAIAKQKLQEGQIEDIEWNIESTFLPIWEGDVIDLVIPEGNDYSGTRRCLVKSIDIKGQFLDMSISLKEVTSA